MSAFKIGTAIFALWAVLMLAGTTQAHNSRFLLQSSKDPLGLQPCSMDKNSAALAAKCPQDNQRYQVCLSGPAVGGCRLESAGSFLGAACTSACFVQSGSG